MTLARSFGMPTDNSGGAITALAVAPNGDAIVCGAFQAGIDIRTGATVTSNGVDDGFIARVTGPTATAWAAGFGGAKSDECNSIAEFPSDQICARNPLPIQRRQDRHPPIPGPGFRPDCRRGREALRRRQIPLEQRFRRQRRHRQPGRHSLLPGDVVYSGSYVGTVDFGGGPRTSGNAGTQPTYFAARRTMDAAASPTVNRRRARRGPCSARAARCCDAACIVSSAPIRPEPARVRQQHLAPATSSSNTDSTPQRRRSRAPHRGLSCRCHRGIRASPRRGFARA